MSDFILNYVDGVILVTLDNVPNNSGSLAKIFNAIGASKINVDMICQTLPYKNKINLSFTIDQGDLGKTLTVVGQLKDEITDLITEVSTGNCKFTIFSELLKTESGVAARLFTALSQNNLQIKLITTSDVEISLLFDNDNIDGIMRVLEKEFILNLD